MKFTVVWQTYAENRLAELWLSSRNRDSLARATNRIEQTLATCPDRVGEQRRNKDRVYFDDPLGVRFRLSIEDRIVQVLDVWDITRR